MFYQRQIERNAIHAWLVYGVKLRLPLSAAARRELARLRRVHATRAGLAELQAAYAEPPRRAFEPTVAHEERVQEARLAARLRTVTEEAIAYSA